MPQPAQLYLIISRHFMSFHSYCYLQYRQVAKIGTTQTKTLGQRVNEIKLEIDPVMPDSLSNNISSTEWEFFCNRVDDALVFIQ